MENSKTPAFPHMVIETDAIDGSTIRNIEYDGLTKREYFAGLVLQGLLANQNTAHQINIAFGKVDSNKANIIVTNTAINIADELLKQLEQK